MRTETPLPPVGTKGKLLGSSPLATKQKRIKFPTRDHVTIDALDHVVTNRHERVTDIGGLFRTNGGEIFRALDDATRNDTRDLRDGRSDRRVQNYGIRVVQE